MRDRLRPALAALLAVALPGLGHVILRRWGRALVWHVTIVGGTVALYTMYDVEPVDPLESPTGFAAAVPPEISVPIAFLVALSAVDAYLVGREQAAAADRAAAAAELVRKHAAEQGVDAPDGVAAEPETVQCPHCGRDTDAEIDFCHWCTEPLPWAEEDAGGSNTANN